MTSTPEIIVTESTVITTRQVKDEYDILAAQLRAGLSREEYERRKREVLAMAHAHVRQEQADRHHDESSCEFCIAERREQNARMDAAPLSKLPGRPAERCGRFRI